MEPERVLIFDTSLRDGEQAPGCSMNTAEKLVLARKLQRLGVDIIEAGFPIASAGDAEGQVDTVPGVARLRISSINPNEVDNNLLDAIVKGRSTCSSMHLVLQSGSNAVLKNMRRLYTRELYLEKVSQFRERCPDFIFTTDVIVGFPGETDDDFLATLDIIKRVKFAKVHMFPYSERPQTRAARASDKLSSEVIKERKAQVLEVADRVAFDLRQSFVGRTMEVLTESGDGSEYFQGQTKNGLPVLLPKASLQPNQLLKVRLQENTSCGFIGSEVIS